MDDILNSTLLSFDVPPKSASFIKVIGVGGGGGNAVSHMYHEGIKDVDFLICNTDRQALDNNPVPTKILIGTGLGAGSRPDVARRAAEERADQIREILSHDTKMLFITATLGGGTGTGASPVIARIAKEIELDDPEIKQILVVAVVTMPFKFEGKRKKAQALEGLEALREYADAILIIDNEKLRTIGNLDVIVAFNKANDVLLTAAKSISEIITRTDIINTDFRDVNTVLTNSGTAYMGTGSGKGDDRAMQAIKAATDSQLLNDTDISGAKNVLLYFSFPPDKTITMDELTCITDYMQERIHDEEANIVWGMGSDETLIDELKVTLVATGFDTSEQKPQQPVIINLEDESHEAPKAPECKDSQENPKIQETPLAQDKSEEPECAVNQEKQDTPECKEAPQERQGRIFYIEDDMPTENESAQASFSTMSEKTASNQILSDTTDNSRSTESVEISEVVAECHETPECRIEPENREDDGIELINVTASKQTTPESQTIQESTESHVTAVFSDYVDKENDTPVVAEAKATPAESTDPFSKLTQPQTDPDQILARSKRIRAIHDLLRNDPNGAAKVEQYNPMTQSRDFSFTAFDDSISQRSELTSSLRHDGTMARPNDHLHKPLD